MEKIKWAVVGGGHAGQAIAGTLGLQGHDVKLYDVFQDLVDAIITEQRKKDPTDVLGSYTGVPWDEWDEPVQDADDL